MIAPIATKPPAMEIKGSKLRLAAFVVVVEVVMLANFSPSMVVVVGGRIA